MVCNSCALCVALLQKDCPIAAAAQAGNVDCVRLLCQQGADVNQPRKDDVTPLLTAAEKSQVECVALLLKAGADPNAVCTKLGGVTPVVMAAIKDAGNCLRLLLDNGGDPNHTMLVRVVVRFVEM